VLGEGPLWSVADQCLYWLDIEQSLLHRYTPGATAAPNSSSGISAAANPSDADAGPDADVPVGGTHSTVRFSSMVGCLALTERPGQVLLAAASGLWLFDWATLRAWPLCPFPEPAAEAAAFRFNDGAVSPAGTFVVGTLLRDESRGAGRGSLYEYACTAAGGVAWRPLLRGVTIPNGIDWSRDGRVMYFVDTPLQRVDAFEWTATPFGDEQGSAVAPAAAATTATTSAQAVSASDSASPALPSPSPLSQRRVAFSIPLEHAHPDGLTLDASGCLWVAHWAGGRVTRWSADGGALLRCIRLPTRQPTCPCFGGPQLRDLYVTSAARGLDPREEPRAGSLFVVPDAGQGRAPNVFKGDIKLDDSKAVQFHLVEQE